MKPYERDIQLLQEELVHHEYIAKKYAQEYDKSLAQKYSKICSDIRNSIKTIEKRQDTAVSEWSALSVTEHQRILVPLYGAMEMVINDIKRSNCIEFAIYFEKSICNFLIDLENFKE